MKFPSQAAILVASIALAIRETIAHIQVDPPVQGEEDTNHSVDRRDTPAEGIDTGYNPVVDWTGYAADGKAFVYIAATDGTSENPVFAGHYQAAHDAGFIRGAYHIAHPVPGHSGATEADYFLDHGGRWNADGTTLPGALWLQFASSRSSCYEMTPAGFNEYIWEFSDRYLSITGRRPVLRTYIWFWTLCSGNTSEFGSTHALWFSDGAPTPGQLPPGWSQYTIWQYASLGTSPTGSPLPNLDRWNGALNSVKSQSASFAAGGI